MENKRKTLARVYELNNFLLQNMKAIFRLRKIGLSKTENQLVYAYTVSLAKDHRHTLEDLTKLFYTLCQKMLADGENLTTDKKCFIVSASDFVVYYYIEAWKKCADKIAYIENGLVKTELLHRMSCEQAAHVFKKRNIEPLEIIDTVEVLKKYENYADKYVALANLSLSRTAPQAAIKDMK